MSSPVAPATVNGAHSRQQISRPDESTPILADSQQFSTYSGVDGAGVGAVPEPDHQQQQQPQQQQRQVSISAAVPIARQLSTSGSVSRQRRKSSSAIASRRSSTVPPHEHEQDSWFRKLLEKYGAVELDNKGSTARDHLALERTFLAWLRTSLSFAGIGIAITQLFRLNSSIPDSTKRSLSRQRSNPIYGATLLDSLDTSFFLTQDVSKSSKLKAMGKPLGAAFLGVAILVLLTGWRRYAESQHYIIRGKFPASRGSIAIATVSAGALIVATFVIIVAVDPALFAKR